MDFINILLGAMLASGYIDEDEEYEL